MLLLFIGGCASTRLEERRVSFVDGSLKGDMLLTDFVSVVNSSGLMEVQVTGRNKTSRYRLLEYRVEWFEGSGLQVPSVMTRWTTCPAFEKANFSFSAVAPKPGVSDFRILIRKAKK
ncbi:YcfL family protein [Pelodictyon luteolum]|nr:YcfL family protein [Pelodictyon luteolum]